MLWAASQSEILGMPQGCFARTSLRLEELPLDHLQGQSWGWVGTTPLWLEKAPRSLQTPQEDEVDACCSCSDEIQHLSFSSLEAGDGFARRCSVRGEDVSSAAGAGSQACPETCFQRTKTRVKKTQLLVYKLTSEPPF